jgi:pre-mRNA-processing factor 40
LAREAARRAEREARAAFVRLLRVRHAAGELGARTAWRDFAPRLAGEPAYEAVCAAAAGSRPRELFQDLLDELGDELSEQARAVEAALRGRDEEADARTEALGEVSSLLAAAGGAAAAAATPAAGGATSNLGIILADRAAAARERRERRERRGRDAFTALLRSRALVVGAAWADVRAELLAESAGRDLPGGEVAAAALYAEYAAALIASGAEPGEVLPVASSRRGREKARKRKHRKQSSSSSSSSSDSRPRGGKGRRRDSRDSSRSRSPRRKRKSHR